MNRIDEEIRGVVERKLRSHYTELSINVRSARRVEGKGIEIRGISIVEPSGNIGSATLLQIDEILVVCQADLSHLLSGAIQAERILIRRPQLRATRRSDGSWSTAQLFPLPEFGGSAPPVVIEDAMVEIEDAASGEHLFLHDAELHLDPTTSGPNQEQTALQFSGFTSGDHFNQLEFKGGFEPARHAWSVAGQVQGIDISSQNLQPWRAQLADLLPSNTSFQLNGACAFRAASGTASEEEIRFAVAGRLAGGYIKDRRLPSLLAQLKGEFYIDNKVARLQKFEAQIGSSPVHLSLECNDWRNKGPATIDLSTSNFELNHAVRNVLPPNLQATWAKFQPGGKIDATVHLDFDGQRWTPTVAAQLRQTSFAYYAFPYRMHRATGSLQLSGNELTIDALAFAEQSPVAITGKIQTPGPDATGWIDIKTQRAVPLTEALVSALNPKQQELVRNFSPRGMLTFSGRFTCCGANNLPKKHFIVGLHDCFIQFSKFPYPLRQLQGVFEVDNDRWTFHDLEARNGGGLVTCSGSFGPAAGGGQHLQMHFDASNVSLEEELYNALSPSTKKLWAELRPRGVVDQLKIELSYDTLPQNFSLDVTAQKWPENPRRPERSLAIVPVWFPYHMDNLTGWAHYRDGVVEVKNIRATHGESRLATHGSAFVAPDGSWKVNLQQLHGDRLRNDHDFVRALPAPLGEAVLKLNLKGPLSIRGGLQFAGGPKQPFQSDWDLHFDFENGSMQCGIDLDHIHGGIQLTGGGQDAEFYSRGELAVDSLMYNGVQVSHITGPVVIDASRITFGAWTPQRANVAPRRLQGDVFEGKLAGDASISLLGDGRFTLRGDLSQGNLEVFSRELMPHSQKISGDAQATIQMTGQGGMHTVRGGGSVTLRNADIYELPQMVQLLKLLRVVPPNANAFDSSDIEYRIVGDQIYFDRLDFSGDAISLRGKGEMDAQRSINLDFKTLVGRDHNRFIGWMLGEASGQLLLIHVDRTLDNPHFTQEPLPGLNKVLQQIFPETRTTPPSSEETRATTQRNRF